MNAPHLGTSILLALALTATQPSPERSTTQAESGPRIHCDITVFNYGAIPFGGDGTCSFSFTNTGNAPLIIHAFRSSCGCLAPHWDQQPVLPGASGTVRLKYDTRRIGPFQKSATLQSNATNTPLVVLQVKGMVLADTAMHR